ncbi:rhomboid-related protein 4-like [Latimeria chalumnae]|uniref:rhomboid-related protein 4-like n=1 Tax=Latimeria chalumnae TaxID=7897 RepID=UPI0006D93AD9|nr:PREDICTED: rhomboid-related protein 4-like isoform X2 [Latimeria chalumnae]|eukprot:XP_014342163.1 PREDICTED: rhomboid-related protein 4-like isoform X2 [Latimeria chalumnae]
MMSLVWHGRNLEPLLGIAWFGYVTVIFSFLSAAVCLLLQLALALLFSDLSYKLECVAGFSGVLFALKAIHYKCSPDGHINVLGCEVSNKLVHAAELIALSLIAPKSSLVAHLAGFVVGMLYITGPLEKIMITFARLVVHNIKEDDLYHPERFSSRHEGDKFEQASVEAFYPYPYHWLPGFRRLFLN